MFARTVNNDTQAATNATLAILAGGQGVRMGRAKAELVINHKPILAHLLDTIDWPGPTLLITAPGREHPPAFERFDREAIDPVPGLGPLRGVLTALEAADTPLVVVTTVDMPRVNSVQLNALLDRLLIDPATVGVMCRRPREHERRASDAHIEPFPSAYRIAARQTVAAMLNRSKGSVHGLLRGRGFITIDPQPGWPGQWWLNLNEPADLDALNALEPGSTQ